MRVLAYLQNPRHAETIAFGATLLCLWIAAHYALKVPRERPRVFTALALLALNWGILLLYYLPGPPQNEILSSFSGFVLVFIGALLHREAVMPPDKAAEPPIVWLDTFPLFLLRTTVMGYGVYLLVKRLFHVDYGISTLALALWGTLITVFGYASLWIGLVFLNRHRIGLTRMAAWLGLFLGTYAAAEVAYAAWYAHDYWPAYRRYLALETRPGAPDFETPLPFHPQPDWPDAHAWSALSTDASALRLKAEPAVPTPWLWLEYALALLKLALTAVVIALTTKRVEQPLTRHSPLLIRWLQTRLRLGNTHGTPG